MKLVNIKDVNCENYYIAYGRNSHTAHIQSPKGLSILKFVELNADEGVYTFEFHMARYYRCMPHNYHSGRIYRFSTSYDCNIYELTEDEVLRVIVAEEL